MGNWAVSGTDWGREIVDEILRIGGATMAGNLPDGVTTSMIPGCRPEDEEYDQQLEDLTDEVQTIFTQFWDTVVEEFVADEFLRTYKDPSSLVSLLVSRLTRKEFERIGAEMLARSI